MKKKSIYGIIVFYTIAVGVRYLTNETELISEITNVFLKIIIQGIGPAVGALVALKIFNLKFSMSLKGFYPKTMMPLIVFWILPVLIIAANTFFTKGNYSYLTVLAILIYGLFEEIGWRGFLHQQLKSIPKIWNILIVAILWFIWHLNFEISMSNFIFFIILILGSWGIGVVADKTKSLFAVASFHSFNNFYSEWNLQNISILTILFVVWVLAIIYIKKLNKKSHQKSPN